MGVHVLNAGVVLNDNMESLVFHAGNLAHTLQV